MSGTRRKEATEMLGRQVDYFRSIQDKLAGEHYGKLVLIHNGAVDGFFDTEIDAYTAAKKKYKPGSFLIRRCITASEETPLVFHSRVGL
jgi:hypothetical protein